MRLCDCEIGPLRSAFAPDRLRCLRCGHWTPHGRILHPERFTAHAKESQSLLAELAGQWPYVHDLAHQATRNGNIGRGSDISDPTASQAIDARRLFIRDRAVIISRLLERALWALKNADEAIGDALLAAEPSGPTDHVQAPYHDPAMLLPSRPDLAEPYAAQARRRARGDL